MTLEPAPLGACDAPGGGRAFWLSAADGARLRVAHWPGDRCVLVLPGRTEAIEKYGLVVADLAAAGWGALVVDWRGQGLSPRLTTDPLRGHVARFADFQADLDAVLAAAETLAPGPMPWLAHSMGGCIALRGAMRGLGPKAVAFSAPMLGLAQPPHLLTLVRLAGAMAQPLGLDRGYAPTTGPAFGLPGMGFEGNNLTADRAQFDRMKAQIAAEPKLALGGPSLRWMAAALDEMGDLAARPSPGAMPALFGLGTEDAIVSVAAIRARAARWPGAALAEYPGARHEILMERPAVRDDFLRRAIALFDAAA